MTVDGGITVVTGATSGIGRAIAEAFGDAGSSVVAIGRDPERLASVAAHRSGRIQSIRGDLADTATMDSVVEQIVAAARPITALVHAAGAFAGGATVASSLDDFDSQMRINVRVPYALTRALLPSLIAAAGQIVFVNSSAGLRASAGNGAYAATKHALRAVADAVRDEANAAGVRVLSVYLGQSATPMQRAIYLDAGRPYEPDRLIQPADVAELVLSIVSLPVGIEVTDVTLRPTRKPA